MGQAQRTRPNILFILTDSWDGRMLATLGHPALRNATPNVDRLVRNGTMFANTYTTHAISAASASTTTSPADTLILPA